MKTVLMLSGLAMGGAERNIVELAPRLISAGIDLRVVTMNKRRDGPIAQVLSENGVRRVDLGARRMLDHGAWRRFGGYLRDEHIELVHAHDQDSIIYTGFARKLIGVPTILTRHVLREPTDTIREKARAALVLLAAKHGFDRAIAVSEAVRQTFSRLSGMHNERISMIHNGIDVERFRCDPGIRPAKRAELGWSDADRVLIMVSVLRRGKGHEVLLEALPSLLARVPETKVKFVGAGELEDQIRAAVAPFGEVVELLGQRTDIPELLSASDALVLPSWSEALPTVLIEAGAASLACVSTDVGGSSEILIDGETGFLVPAGNPSELAERLARVLGDLSAAREMGHAAHRRVAENFSLGNQVARTAHVYQEVLDSAANRS